MPAYTGLSPRDAPGGFVVRGDGGDHVTAVPGDLDVMALLTATQAALKCRVSVDLICKWRDRGHLPIAVDDDGEPILDARGKNMYRLLEVAKTDAKMAARREAMVRRLALASA
jgi:hypothetical protein